MSAICPIHKTTDCVKRKKSFPVKQIIDLYKIHNIDTEANFNSLENIDQYICTKTKYRFFFPETIAGNQLFYEQIFKQLHYYLPWKWEYDQALRWISEKKSVLEIACGDGNFLKKVSKKASFCVGLDLTAEPFSENNIKILKQNYISFFENNTTKFDVIVAFHFLEHIYNINKFFHYVSNSLNPNGRLILAVPDNKCFIIKKEKILNFPPHHMGWWTKKALKKTGEFFGFKIVFFKTESLQPYEVNARSYFKEVERIEKLGILGKILNKLTHKLFLFIYTKFPFFFKGMTFIIVMDKK